MQELARVGRENSDATVLFHAAMAKRLDLHPTDYKALGVLERRGAMSAGEIARITGLATASVTNLVDRLEQKGSCAGHDHPTAGESWWRPSRTASRRRPLFASTTRSLSELFRRYSEADLAVIADFLKRNAERLREDEEARVHATCRGRGAPMNPVLSIVVGLAAVGAGLWHTSWAIEAMRRVPKAPSRLPWAPAIPIEMIDVGGHRLRFIKTGQGPSLVLLHTLRTQLDLFAKVIPELSGTSRSTPWTIPGTASRTFRGRVMTPRSSPRRSRVSSNDSSFATSPWRASRSVERSRSSSPRVAIRVSRGWSPSTPTTTPRAGHGAQLGARLAGDPCISTSRDRRDGDADAELSHHEIGVSWRRRRRNIRPRSSRKCA